MDAPDLLSETGLYSDIASGQLAAGVMSFSPRFPLWSDGAEKRRWVLFPRGEQIDTADTDNWRFPIGTRAWKEFRRDGVRIETRYLEKVGHDDWAMMSYLWNAEGSDAEALPNGLSNAHGTPHDIPTTNECFACHSGMSDALIGLSAIQLDHSGDGLSLKSIRRQALATTQVPSVQIPGNQTTIAALGYLHGNCGSCHNSRSAFGTLNLWLSAESMGTVEETNTFVTAVGQKANFDVDLKAKELISPGKPDKSLLLLRMKTRGAGKMPLIGTEIVDRAGISAVAAWIEQL